MHQVDYELDRVELVQEVLGHVLGLVVAMAVPLAQLLQLLLGDLVLRRALLQEGEARKQPEVLLLVGRPATAVALEHVGPVVVVRSAMRELLGRVLGQQLALGDELEDLLPRLVARDLGPVVESGAPVISVAVVALAMARAPLHAAADGAQRGEVEGGREVNVVRVARQRGFRVGGGSDVALAVTPPTDRQRAGRRHVRGGALLEDAVALDRVEPVGPSPPQPADQAGVVVVVAPDVGRDEVQLALRRDRLLEGRQLDAAVDEVSAGVFDRVPADGGHDPRPAGGVGGGEQRVRARQQ